jgi:aconitate hydratase
MGILPLQFLPGESATSFGLTGREAYTIHGLGGLTPRARVPVTVRSDDGAERIVTMIARLDGAIDVEYVRQGGILPAVIRRLATAT